MTDTPKKINKTWMDSMKLKYLSELKKRQIKLSEYLALAKHSVHETELDPYIAAKKDACRVPGDLEFMEIERIAHSMSGTGATFGFPIISELAHILEDHVRESPNKIDATIIQDIQNLIDACKVCYSENTSAHEGEVLNLLSSTLESVAAKKLPVLLVVDDDEDVHNLLRELLKKEVRVITSTNAMDGIEIIKSHRPDIVILDDIMPGELSGLDMLELIQQMPDEIKSIPIIMLTVRKHSADAERARKAGAVNYITKPVDPMNLLEKIQLLLKSLQKTVMIVDDDKEIIALLEHAFHVAGCRVKTAEDGTQALKMMGENPPNLLLLDRSMPGLDGISVLKKMRDTPSLQSVPIIFLTAKGQEQDILEGFNHGAADYITKPFSLEVLLARCMRIMKVGDLEKLATIDSKTNANNYYAFENQAELCFKQMARYKAGILHGFKDKKPEITFVAIDLDGFKQINDTEGHAAGDEALKEVVNFFMLKLRPNDFFARVGGDEFAIIMSANGDATHKVMRRLRLAFDKKFTPPGRDIPKLSFSYGVCQLEPDEELHAVIQMSDQAQLQEKNERRSLKTKNSGL